MPEDGAQLVVVAEPERAAQLGCDDAQLQVGLIPARPDARLIERQLVIDSERTPCTRAPGRQREYHQPRSRTGHCFRDPPIDGRHGVGRCAQLNSTVAHRQKSDTAASRKRSPGTLSCSRRLHRSACVANTGSPFMRTKKPRARVLPLALFSLTPLALPVAAQAADPACRLGT